MQCTMMTNHVIKTKSKNQKRQKEKTRHNDPVSFKDEKAFNNKTPRVAQHQRSRLASPSDVVPHNLNPSNPSLMREKRVPQQVYEQFIRPAPRGEGSERFSPLHSRVSRQRRRLISSSTANREPWQLAHSHLDAQIQKHKHTATPLLRAGQKKTHFQTPRASREGVHGPNKRNNINRRLRRLPSSSKCPRSLAVAIRRGFCSRASDVSRRKHVRRGLRHVRRGAVRHRERRPNAAAAAVHHGHLTARRRSSGRCRRRRRGIRVAVREVGSWTSSSDTHRVGRTIERSLGGAGMCVEVIARAGKLRC